MSAIEIKYLLNELKTRITTQTGFSAEEVFTLPSHRPPPGFTYDRFISIVHTPAEVGDLHDRQALHLVHRLEIGVVGSVLVSPYEVFQAEVLEKELYQVLDKVRRAVVGDPFGLLSAVNTNITNEDRRFLTPLYWSGDKEPEVVGSEFFSADPIETGKVGIVIVSHYNGLEQIIRNASI